MLDFFFNFPVNGARIYNRQCLTLLPKIASWISFPVTSAKDHGLIEVADAKNSADQAIYVMRYFYFKSNHNGKPLHSLSDKNVTHRA